MDEERVLTEGEQSPEKKRATFSEWCMEWMETIVVAFVAEVWPVLLPVVQDGLGAGPADAGQGHQLLQSRGVDVHPLPAPGVYRGRPLMGKLLERPHCCASQREAQHHSGSSRYGRRQRLAQLHFVPPNSVQTRFLPVARVKTF